MAAAHLQCPLQCICCLASTAQPRVCLLPPVRSCRIGMCLRFRRCRRSQSAAMPGCALPAAVPCEGSGSHLDVRRSRDRAPQHVCSPMEPAHARRVSTMVLPRSRRAALPPLRNAAPAAEAHLNKPRRTDSILCDGVATSMLCTQCYRCYELVRAGPVRSSPGRRRRSMRIYRQAQGPKRA